MPLANSHRGMMKRANELGYFPTPAQAKKISLLSADRYFKMVEDGYAPRKGPMHAQTLLECMDGAIREVMDRIPRLKQTITGTADKALADHVEAAIKKAKGKNLRVRIEEV